MSNTLISFRDKNYKYGESVDTSRKGLTIGGYESAWLADLVAAYLLNNIDQLLKKLASIMGCIGMTE